MKLSTIALITMMATSDALAPPSSDRRAFLAKATASTSAAAFATVAASAPAFAKDEYSLDTGDIKVPEKVKAESKGGSIVTGALGASVLLSLPFFLPNLMRLAGVNNAKNPDKK
eukprot:CAMPEP_0194085194 /NCGR_PEP_ID=MMETSP0149-20130528/16638_1 /TAXON_ID=122233 /ORGANISM="Chaetoceros debilis, Strain MM31A-1" /LENGTH=113 /DNA_ID=CAMNT_0038768021 /DNA_START=83 /DNA_END=424 /DNA_ORIENTATION=+